MVRPFLEIKTDFRETNKILHLNACENYKLGYDPIYCIYLYKRPSILISPPPPLLLTFAKFIFRGFTFISTASTFAIPSFRKKMRFSTSRIEYRLREKRISKQNKAIFITAAMKFVTIPDKLYNFFKFNVSFQYFKLSRHYTYWQARSRLKKSIIAHYHWT